MHDSNATDRDYVLGHTPRELDRLDRQGALYREFTRRLFVDAGLGPGHRVLDLGSGSGDVAYLAHALVAPPQGPDTGGSSAEGTGRGEVVGLERDADTVAAARARATHEGLDRVAFRVGELGERLNEAPFDAIVGRFILMHQPDPATVLRKALVNARPGTAVAFVESSMTSLMEGVHSHPFSPLYDRIVRWKGAVVGGAGADLAAGMRLRRVFIEAGLPAPTTRFKAHVEGGPDSPWYAYIEESVRSMLPMARRLGVEGFDENEIDTLAERLRRETVEAEGVLMGWPVVTAWSRVP